MLYKVKVVYNNIDNKLQNQIIDLWVKNKVLPFAEAKRRVSEVVTVGYNQNQEIIGVSTVYSRYFSPLNGNYYFYRMFVAPDYRNRLIKRDGGDFMSVTYEHLQSNPSNHKGIIVVIENTKISDKIIGGIFGFSFLGLNENRLKIWFKNF